MMIHLFQTCKIRLVVSIKGYFQYYTFLTLEVVYLMKVVSFTYILIITNTRLQILLYKRQDTILSSREKLGSVLSKCTESTF